MNGCLWVLRSGAHWQHLPERYGKWKTVHRRFSRWCHAGVWERGARSEMTDGDGRQEVRGARVYLRVSTDEQDLARQEAIVVGARAAGYYVAAAYREKVSGARADRPELLRMIADLQHGEVVVAEKIDRISRLPLAEAG